MGFKEFHRIAAVLFFSIAIAVQASGQVVVERSNDKVIISGTAYYIHYVKKGETAYSISRAYGIPVDELTKENPPALYGVSENEIISSNPGIDINKLSVGSEIAVPKRGFMTERQEFEVQEGSYIFHKVVRGESLSSIADKYGISIRELRKENRDIRFPQVGDYLRIPVPEVEREAVTDKPASDTVPE